MLILNLLSGAILLCHFLCVLNRMSARGNHFYRLFYVLLGVGVLAASVLVIGYVASIKHASALEYSPWAAKSVDVLRWFGAFAAGVSAQTIVPLALGWLKKKGGQ